MYVARKSSFDIINLKSPTDKVTPLLYCNSNNNYTAMWAKACCNILLMGFNQFVARPLS